MTVDGVVNVRAETTPLRADMHVRAQNVVGSAEFDLMGFLDKLSLLMPVGFYYRTLHRPRSLWPIALKQIRRAAGLGRISPGFRMEGRFDEAYLHAEVCVIGGGSAGMTAALAAAETGLRVVLLEARPWLGGCNDYRLGPGTDGTPLYERSRALAGKVAAAGNIRVLCRTPMIAADNGHLLTAFQVGGDSDPFTERYLQIRAQSVVAATGCIERPLLFENNDRPGVMQIACAHRLARSYGLLPGKEAVFSVGHDLGLEAAADLSDLGVKVHCVADARQEGQNPALVEALAERGIPLHRGWVATCAHGSRRVKQVTLSTVEGTVTRKIDCDLLAASAGLTPVTGPLTVAGATLTYDLHTGYFLPETLPPRVHAAGRLLGLSDPGAVEASGRLAGLRAASECGKTVDLSKAADALAGFAGPDAGCKLVTAPVKGKKAFVCFDEDATVKNVRQAIDMGFDVPELIKRFAAVGLGPGQGGVPGHNLPLLAARHRADPLPPKPTTVRSPLVPALIATYAGTHRDMCKRTPVHASQKKAGGVFRRIGVWQRARYFSDDLDCKDEILAVRNNVGMLDASTLGKFRIHGPDALEALQRVFVSDMSRVTSGRVKYSAMCNDDGCVIDDGVVVRTGENDYYFTTSTGRAGQTVEWIRYHTRFDGWNFHLVNLTDAMGVINLAGPNARKVLGAIADGDVSNEAFPFSGYRIFTVAGKIPVRAMRLGFVGELSYELHVPSSLMQALWDIVAEAGSALGIRNYGVEAQNVLRMEKGHVIVGQESEQRTNLLDLGLGFLWDRGKGDAKTVGAVALRQAENDPGRLTLVGIEMDDPALAASDGSVIVDDRIRGYVCTMRNSLTLNRTIGMALVESQLSKVGSRLEIFQDECNGETLRATVVPMPFYDPDGARMKA
jgi:sarcosine oxidase subunit alpha